MAELPGGTGDGGPSSGGPSAHGGLTVLTPGDATVKVYKVVVIGDGSSGKTSIVNRYAQESFGKQYRQTVGLDWYSKRVDLPGGRSATLQLWDIGGQSLTGKMIRNYIEGADAVVLVYDLTNAASFENLQDWLDLVKNHFATKDRTPHVALVGNKRDLSHLRVVSQAAHEGFAKANKASSHFLSAKSGDGVALMFRLVLSFLSGIPVTKAEIEQLQSRVLEADVVEHTDAPQQAVRYTGAKKKAKGGKTAKSKICSVQ